MKIVCALSPKQVENLYKDVYKNMLNALEADKAFNANDYMKTLFTQIAEKKDVATAMKFLQQVPGIMRAVGVKSQFDALDISLDALKPLATNFKNEKDGFKNVLEYFKPEMSDKDKLELLVANQFISSLPTEIENPKEIKDPFRFRPFGWLSTTFQQLIQLNPNNKLRLLSEKPDANKNRIYNTIEKIQGKISAEQAVVTDGTLVVDGKVLKLTPVRLLDLYDTNQADIDNTTAQDVVRTKSITNRPEGVETQNRIALVLSDEEGNYYHFTEEGDFTTKEEGGKIVYQFLRNVNKNAAGEYDALNQYGYGNQIQTPEMVAEKLEITVEEAKKLQQEELKQLYEVKQAVINNQKIKPLNVVELSAGVPESLAQKKISLKNLRSLPFVNNATFKTITPVIEKGSETAAEIELNGKIYRLDRPELSEILIQKIASALTNPKLSNKQKYDFISQFLADKADLKNRRHIVLYNAGTDTLTFQYTEKTYGDGTGAIYTLLNDQLNNKYDLVYDVLRYAKGDSRKGKPFPAKMAYVQDVLTRNAYRDYNIETGELSDEYNTPYIPLLETLEDANIKISESTDPGFYNTYIKFSIPSELSVEVSETETAAEPVVQTPKEERDNIIAPENTPTPNEGGLGSLFGDDQMYRSGKNLDLENITPEDIKNAETWWNNSPLSKFIDFKTMVNIVNSDVYAKFIAYGAVLNNKYGEIQISQRTSIVDVYHEAWHGFTQLFLTPTERKALYDEVAKQKGSFTLLDGTTVKFSEAKYRQLEEYLAEEFRTYAKEEGVKANSPKRNTIFRKILNFLKNLFKSKTTKDKLFNELYLASKNKKNSQKFLNKYSPLANTFNFKELNRGIEDVLEPTIDALDKQDSNLVSKSIDSFFSLTADQYSEQAGTKEATIRVFTNEKAKEKIYAEAKVDFQNKLNTAKEQLEEIQDDPTKALEIEKLQNKIKIFETALKNWGDKKSGVIAYHNENSDYKIINKKFKEIKDEEEDDTTTQSQTANSKSVENSEQGETLGIKDDTQTKSLLDLASSETIVLLSSLHKIQDGKVVLNELGYPELADFASTWNNTIRAVNGEKNPSKMLENIRAAAQTTYPEFKQLLRKFPGYTIQDGKIVINERNRFEVNTLTSFWQDFQKTRVTYLQTTVFDNNVAEVTKASIETMSLMRKFQAKFKSDLENDFIGRTAENVAFLKVAEVVAEFGKDGKLDSNRAYEFARAMGLYLDDLSIIKNELNLNQKAKQMYGLIYIYRNMYDIDQAMKNPKTTQETANEINEFLLDPIGKLSSGFTAGTISEKAVRQKNAIDRILGLQAKYGFDSANFAVLNAEKNLVFEHIDDHTISYITYALNKMQNLSEAWTPGSEFEYMSYLNPLINSFTTRLGIINTMFDKNDTEDGVYNWVKRSGKSLQLFINSGTQVEAIEDGTNTTSLDARGKFLQELHSMLKGGMIEFMRHASKSSSFGARIDGEGGILGGVGKGEDTRLWVDTDKFATGNAYEYVVKNHMIPYIAGELERINKFKTNRDLFKTYAGYNRELADGTMAGENFTAFDNVLRKNTKEEILSAVTNPNVRFEDYIKTNPVLYKKILDEVTTYFTDQAKDLQNYYNEAKYLSPDLLDKLAVFNLGQEKAEEALISAYAVNSWVQNFETATLFYGDIVQYNHEKEEIHKRNAGATSGGLKMRTDQSIRNYLTNLNGKLSYAQAEGLETLAYTGKFNSAIIQDIVRESVYSPVIERELRKDYTERLKGKVPADKLSEEVEMRVAQDLKPYAKMEEGDGQGWITFDAYRNLKIASNEWSDIQEQLYLKVIRKEPVKYSDIIEAFPVYKVQNFGHLANTSLPVMAMHKFALAPLIPSMIKNSDLESLHKQMIKSNIQYVTFQTGSKVGSVTSEVNEKGQAVADKIYNDDEQKSLKTDIKFTPNTVYLEYLKDVTKVPVSYKNKTVFATQLRKLILSNLYRNGELTVKNQVLVKDYEDAVDAYGEFLKMELLNEIGYKFEDGKYIGNFKNFLELVQRELGRKNIPEHHIEFINMNPDNSLKTDLSFHLRADEIEKIIVSLIEKRLVRQKIKGEALVQVSSAMTNGIWDNQIQFDKADIEQVRKFMGTNNLPFYNYNKDRTSAMKVAIALQGDFVNLLNLDYKGEKIGTRERLNQAIKDDEWLNANDGANRKAITMIAVRIPVQGLNSMEYMEVYEFLDEAAGPIIIPPSEIVAKSGADFDVDKLTTFMPSLDKSGKFVESAISNERLQNLLDQNKDTEEGKQMNARLLSTQKAALENKLITSLSNILSLPENYASLVRPNATYLLKDELADKLEDKVTDYDRFKNYHGEEGRLNAKGKKAISPTRVLEPLYNLHKHEANMIGKKVLGIVAIYNALHPVLNTLGAAMPKTYTYKKQKGRKSRVLLPVNKTKDGRISLSDITTVDGDLISELYSQLINGSVDVEKDAWIFFIQGNEEMIGLMAMLLKSGVPREHAIKFLSQPLVREYAKEQRLLKSSYSDLITDNSGVPREETYVDMYTGQTVSIKISDKEVAAARVLAKFGVAKPMMFVKGNADQKSLDAFIQKGNILNKEGVFDLKLLDNILNNPNNSAYKDHQIATLLHVIELEKQFSGYQELMRLSNPDTAISKTLQQVLNRNVLLDEIENDSRVEGKVVKALRKESILSTFFDNQIVQDLVEPVFPLRNSKDISNIIINLIKNNGFQIVKRFGDTEMFISDIKNNMVNSVFQNYMVGYVQSEKDLLNIPSDILAKYFTKDVFFQNTGYSFAEDLFDIINTNPELKDNYSLLSQLSIPEVKDGQKILTLNNSRLLSKGNVAEQYYQNIRDLADPNVSKVADPIKNKYISDMFRVLPLVAVYQNGVGYSRFGFNEILPFEDYVTIMNNAAVDFNNQNFEDKQRYMDRVFNISMNPRNKMFKNFVSAAFVSTTPTFEKKNRFTVIPQAGVKDAKAVIKASIATQFIGFGEGIVGKDGKRSSTQIYREQVGTLANTGKYSGTDVIFVSIPGLRGDAAIVKREQDKTIREAIKAIEAGATILVDNKAYTFDSKNTYNTGEKRLFQNLEAKGYNYSEITIDGIKIGTWSKSRTTQPSLGTETAEQIYSQLGSKTQSENVKIAGKDELSDIKYDPKTFWSKVVPEAKGQFGDQIIVAYRGNRNNTFEKNYKESSTGVTIGNPFDFADETGTREEQGIKSTKKFIHWMITGDNMGNEQATPEYREAIINDIKNGKLKNRNIIYYQEKGYATHATALDYLINQYDWNKATTQPKQGPQPGEQLDLFNQLSINPNQKFDKELAKKIQDKLQKLYPEIKLNISNTPVWEQGDNVLNQEQYNNQVNYRIKTVDILLTPKADQVFAKGIKNKWTLDKILTELQIPKNQKGLIERVIETMPYFEGIPFNAQLAYEIVSTYDYTIEINTATRNFSEKEKPTQYYSNLTVPGGTNYTENEIATPAITPSIKGHAQFATDNGIGWFRSDDLDYIPTDDEYYSNYDYEKGESTYTESKTRRILEVQSDLFQKGRDREDLISEIGTDSYSGDEEWIEFNGKEWEAHNGRIGILDTFPTRKEAAKFLGLTEDPQKGNQFLQLLNKDNNWVNFFVKSIIQDSAKKGYEKVLFPSGNTASKVEGHTTLEEFKKQKEDRIKELEEGMDDYNYELSPNYYFEENGKYYWEDLQAGQFGGESVIEITKEIYDKGKKGELQREAREREINQLKQELERVEGPEGFGALRPIYNFYENVMSNVLKKQGYTPTQFTDEYGNTWNEVIINQARDLQNVLLQKNEADKIIGQANIKAMTVLIDAVNQRQDTLPHEYAHHYIAWFRNTPIVQEGIKRFGSEEALVQAIGEQVVKQKGDAYNWWKKFTNFILNLLSDKQVLQVLTDSFLNRTNLNEFMYNEEMESQEIESETSQERQEKINTLNEPEFKNWFTNEATKNPDLDILDALDYYMKCKR